MASSSILGDPQLPNARVWEPGVHWSKYLKDDMFKEAVQAAGWGAGVTNRQSPEATLS